MKSKILSATLALTLLAFTNADYNVASYCQLVKPGTMLPSLDSCQNYYTCSSSGQPVLSSCSSGNVFDKDSQQCVPPGSSSCFIGLANPCQNQDKKFVPSSALCSEWHYCEAGTVVGTGSCVKGQIFSYSTQSCIYGECSNTDSGSSNTLDTSNLNICQIIPSGIFFGDTQNCSAWHKCSGMLETSNTCPDGYNFDPTYAACVPNNSQYSNACARMQIPGVSGPPANSNCVVGTSVGDPSSCSVYYTCVNSAQTNTTSWTTNTCNYQYFDVISGQCNSTSLARAYEGCNRCQFNTASLYWANAVDPTCSTYLTCSNGQESKSKPGACGQGNFFNEALQYCIIGNSTLSQYTQTHGACQNYKCDPKTRVCTLATTAAPAPAPGSNGTASSPAPGSTGTESSPAPGSASSPAPGSTGNASSPAPGSTSTESSPAPGSASSPAPGSTSSASSPAPGSTDTASSSAPSSTSAAASPSTSSPA